MKLFFALLFSFSTYAANQSWFELKNATFGIGSYTEFFQKMQIDSQGGKNDYTFNPTLTFGAEAKTFASYYFYPEVVLVWHDSGEYGKLTKTTFMFRLDLGRKFLKEKLLLTTGTSLVVTMLKGSGGTISLQNGDNLSEDFFAPNENRYSINNTFDLGLSYFVDSAYSVKLQTLTFSLFESEKRAVSYFLSFNYFWGGVKEMDFLK